MRSVQASNPGSGTQYVLIQLMPTVITMTTIATRQEKVNTVTKPYCVIGLGLFRCCCIRTKTEARFWEDTPVLERHRTLSPKHRRALTAEPQPWVLGSESPKQVARKVENTDEHLPGGPTLHLRPQLEQHQLHSYPGNSYRHLVYL